MIDLTTRYLGLELPSPIVASASPLSMNLDDITLMQECGVGAVVLHSLFEEQIDRESADLDRFLEHGAESFAEATTYLPDMADYNLGIDGYLEHIRECKSLVRIPIIASLNGATPGGWIRLARDMQDAGADAIELNIYFLPTDPHRDAVWMENQYIELVEAIRRTVRVPLAVKISPGFTAPIAFARRLQEAGANGIVLFNRFYQPDFDLERLEVVPTLRLSTAQELPLRLHWTALMFGHVHHLDIAITGGVHSGHDVLKSMMAGARVAMTTSSLMKFGIDHLRSMRKEMLDWMFEHDYESVRQMQGSMSFARVPHPERFERANYLRVLRSYSETKF
jgi:dihydroorotate dehydrogenase (fumarate)